MRHDVYSLPYNSTTLDNHRGLKSADTRPLLKKLFSLTGDQTKLCFQIAIFVQRLLMVGPVPGEWNLLRATDGERFVVTQKNNGFWGELLTAKTKD